MPRRRRSRNAPTQGWPDASSRRRRPARRPDIGHGVVDALVPAQRKFRRHGHAPQTPVGSTTVQRKAGAAAFTSKNSAKISPVSPNCHLIAFARCGATALPAHRGVVVGVSQKADPLARVRFIAPQRTTGPAVVRRPVDRRFQFTGASPASLLAGTASQNHQSPICCLSFSIAWLMLKLPGRWAGGYSLNVSKNSPVSAWAPYMI
jgi:hypothetical protein